MLLRGLLGLDARDYIVECLIDLEVGAYVDLNDGYMAGESGSSSSLFGPLVSLEFQDGTSVPGRAWSPTLTK